MDLMTPPEAQRELRISRSQIWRELLSERLPSVRIGRRRLILRSDLVSYVTARRVGRDESTTGAGAAPMVRGGRANGRRHRV